MTLRVDYTAERNLRGIVGGLRSARLGAGLTQNAVSEGLPVRGRAISEWETGAAEPTLEHLIYWSRALGRRLVIVGRNGEVFNYALRHRPGESWEVFERRRLAWPLKNRRVALGMSQGELCSLVGVTRDSIQRWELARVPPRPIAHIVWAHRLGYSIALRPIDDRLGTRPYGVPRGLGIVQGNRGKLRQ